MIDTQLKNKTKIDNNKNNKMMINCIDHCYKCNSLSLTSKNKRKQVIKSDLNNYNNSVSRKLTLKARAIARKKTKRRRRQKDKDQAII